MLGVQHVCDSALISIKAHLAVGRLSVGRLCSALAALVSMTAPGGTWRWSLAEQHVKQGDDEKEQRDHSPVPTKSES